MKMGGTIRCYEETNGPESCSSTCVRILISKHAAAFTEQADYLAPAYYPEP